MIFVLPTFNLFGDIWYNPDLPVGGPGNAVNVPMQLYLPSRSLVRDEETDGYFQQAPIYVRMPIGDIAAWQSAWLVECPVGSGRYYLPTFKERYHQGFLNEYLGIVCIQCDEFRIPVIRDVDTSFPVYQGYSTEDDFDLFAQSGVPYQQE